MEKGMMNCKAEDCDKPIAPADGEFCISHSKKLASPYSAMQSKQQASQSRAALAAKGGINTSVDFAAFMGGLMSDLVEGKIEPDIAVAAVKAGNALLHILELRLKFGFKNEALELGEAKSGIAAPSHLEMSHSAKKAQ